jgi:RNA polymerase sigma-70 factor (ECF subfamily)
MIFLRRYWYASSAAEIAEEYGMRENSVNVLLHRTRKKLKDHLQKEGFDL